MRSLHVQRVVLACLLFAGLLVTAGWSQTNITGTWSGSFDITQPDGAVQHDTAYLVLTQNGPAITGTVGPNEDHRINITTGKITDSDIQLSAEMEDGGKLVFRMRLEGEHIKGDVSGDTPGGRVEAKIDVTRVKEKAARVNGPPRLLIAVGVANARGSRQ